MKPKQELQNAIRELLENSGFFQNIRIRGNLDQENNNIDIEFRPNESMRLFHRALSRLEQTIDDIIKNYFYHGLGTAYTGPDEQKTYAIKITRCPIEGMEHNTSEKFLEKLYNAISDKYFFKKNT
ncbi:hypothetical protein J4221_00595 [Candidatus Pacearchaeota archaeon]|nr:hypothetical protein [Candidatus Pacearchaeota archaeon]